MRLRLAVLAGLVAAALLAALVLSPARALITALAHSLRGAVGARLDDPHRGLLVADQPAPPPPPLSAARPVSLTAQGFYSWALLDRETGVMSGSANYTTGLNTTESMVKAWIASDYLRRLAAAGQQPSQQRLDELTRMIRDSDDDAAQDIYQLGGANAVIQRLIGTCGLTDTRIHSGWWSMTQVTARDAVRMGLCIGDGQAAGPKWTSWILGEMRQVRGTVAEEPNGGRWGIIDGLPADVAKETSIKNGWTLIFADGMWHLNCLAVHSKFVLAVLTRYQGTLGKEYGAGLCKTVTEQLLTRQK
jgi:hypothetical protein